MMSVDGFNRIAPYYDSLKRLVFGKSIYRSQIRFLNALPVDGKFLVLGGGSGEILTPLLKLNPGCHIWYLEASSEMLSRAVRSVAMEKRANIRFIHGTENSLTSDTVFDGVITNFFLDLFPDRGVMDIARKIKQHLRKEGLWLVSDFVDSGKWWQHSLLKVMYRFFRITCKIEAHQLPAWENQLRLTGLEQKTCACFYGDFIKSCIYQKSTN